MKELQCNHFTKANAYLAVIINGHKDEKRGKQPNIICLPSEIQMDI